MISRSHLMTTWENKKHLKKHKVTKRANWHGTVRLFWLAAAYADVNIEYNHSGICVLSNQHGAYKCEIHAWFRNARNIFNSRTGTAKRKKPHHIKKKSAKSPKSEVESSTYTGQRRSSDFGFLDYQYSFSVHYILKYWNQWHQNSDFIYHELLASVTLLVWLSSSEHLFHECVVNFCTSGLVTLVLAEITVKDYS